MARSKLLGDVLDPSVNIENILFRLKVILSDLNNSYIDRWIRGELEGYKEVDELPEYRKTEGVVMGTFFVNNSVKYTNSNVPLEILIDSQKIKGIKTLHFHDSINSIQEHVNRDDNSTFEKIIPTAFCHHISSYSLQIGSMKVKASHTVFSGIISSVKSKLVEIIMELEKQFDNIDDLDISPQLDSHKVDTKEVTYNIEKIIFGDPISIGDGNRIEKSDIGHIVNGKE
ncbi:hypothetical protein [Paraliobacillus sediminis]|uniref:AbiTii domain-containing protein n=1 Tax=Paraliobacillus sediminis TaxID=1885916 RepID=UPI000E3E16F5|nr:hypothetical protein [Paraliobacillus sediminis]